MAEVTLTFEFKINSSVQTGDLVYYTTTSTDSGFNVGGKPILIGDIKTVNSYNKTNGTQSIVCNLQSNSIPPNNTYIFFSKNNEVNMSSIRGYYGLARFTNDSTSVGELFSVDCGVSQSSK